MTEDARANLRLVGKLLALSGAVLTIASIATAIGLLPLSAPAARAVAIVLAVTAAVDLIAAFFFLARYRA